MKKPRKPKHISLYDGYAEYYDCEPDELGGGAECLDIQVTLYEIKDAKKLHKWLGSAIDYLTYLENTRRK